MKDEKKKYILVDAKDINITLRKHERVSGFNDFWNEYTPCGETTAEKVFEEHGLPKEFHKIAFSLPTCRCCRADSKEVLTGRNFEITKDRQKKEYYGSECARMYDGDFIAGSMCFRTPKKKESYETVLSFYEQLTEQGYLDSYVEAIKSMFFVEYELAFNGETTKVEDKAATLLKTRQTKKVS